MPFVSFQPMCKKALDIIYREKEEHPDVTPLTIKSIICTTPPWAERDQLLPEKLQWPKPDTRQVIFRALSHRLFLPSFISFQIQIANHYRTLFGDEKEKPLTVGELVRLTAPLKVKPDSGAKRDTWLFVCQVDFSLLACFIVSLLFSLVFSQVKLLMDKTPRNLVYCVLPPWR